MPGKAPRQKGNRFEREIVDELRAVGIDAYRVPLSGSMRGFKTDCVIRLADQELTIEAKVRANGFSFIYNAIKDADLLAVKVDRGEPLLIMRLSEAAAILGAKHGSLGAPAQSNPTQVKSSHPHPTSSIVPRVNKDCAAVTCDGWRKLYDPESRG